MFKKLTYLLLMLIVGITSSWADDVIETVGATDYTSAFGTWDQNHQTIEGDGGLHYTFINHNVTTNDTWKNFVFEANDGNGKYIDLTAPNNSWGDLTTGKRLSNTYDWTNFMTDLNGATVDMYIYKKGTHVLIESTITTSANATRKYQAYYPNVNADKLTCYLGVEAAYIEITKRETATLPTNVDIADEIVGYLDLSSSFCGVSGTEYTLDNNGNGKEIKFKNVSDGSANYKNWILRCYNNDATWALNFNLRCDNAAGFADCWSWDEAASKYTFTKEFTGYDGFNWDNFKTDMKDATVDMKIWRKNGTVNVNAITTTTDNKTMTYNFTMSNITSDNCAFALSQEAAVLDIQSVTDYAVVDPVTSPNWSIDFSALGLTADVVATVSSAVSSGLGTVTLGTTALDTRFGVQADTSWKFYKNGYLQNTNKGGRSLGVFGAKAGQLLVLNATAEATPTTNATLKFSYGNQHVYEVTADGDVVLNMPKNSPIYSIQVSDKLYTYEVKAKSGDTELATIAAGVAEKGASATACWNKYIKVNDAWYVCDETTYGATLDETTSTKTVSYTAETSDIVSFAEGESSTAVAGTNYAYSNGQEGYVAGQNARNRGISVGTLAAGNYQLVVNMTGSNGRYVVLRSGANDPFASIFQAKTDATGIKTVDFTLNAETSEIWLNGANSGEVKTSQSENFDYVLIKKMPAKYNWTAKTNVGDVTLGSGTCYAGTAVTVAYPKYVNVDGILYVKEAAKSTPYKATFTPDKDNYEYVAEYTATEIKDVVYFSEGENITGATATDAGSNMATRSSNAQCGYATSDITLANLAAGIYKATVVQYSNSSAGLTLKFQAGETYSTVTESSANWDEKTFDFTLTDAADFKWLTSGSEKSALDFIYIVKTGEYTPEVTVERSVKTDQYGTICLPYDATTVEGAQLMTMNGRTADATGIRFDYATELKAGVPYLYRATADNQKFTYTKSGAETAATEVNKWTGTYESKDLTNGEYFFYNVDNKFHPSNGYVTIAPYKCYLNTTDVNNLTEATTSKAKAVTFGIFSDVTGINAINFNDVKSAADGKYIQNGKLVIVKNGKQFNAAGQNIK